jgi:hypothetical protein
MRAFPNRVKTTAETLYKPNARTKTETVGDFPATNPAKLEHHACKLTAFRVNTQANFSPNVRANLRISARPSFPGGGIVVVLYRKLYAAVVCAHTRQRKRDVNDTPAARTIQRNFAPSETVPYKLVSRHREPY